MVSNLNFFIPCSLFLEIVNVRPEQIGLCHPEKYEEHYMQVFVRDEKKHDAAKYAFNKAVKNVYDHFHRTDRSEQGNIQLLSSPIKERPYPSQKEHIRRYSLGMS